MSEDGIPNILQSALRLVCRIIGELDNFLDSSGDDPLFRAAFLAELGLPLNALDDPQVAEHLKSPCSGRLQDFIEAKNPDLQAFESVMEDIQAYINAWGAVINAALTENTTVALNEIVNQIFELATLNHLKYRHPGLYYWARLIGFIYFEYQVQLWERVDYNRIVQFATDPKGYFAHRLDELAAFYADVRMAGVPQAPTIGSCAVQPPPVIDPRIAPHIGQAVFAWSDLALVWVPFVSKLFTPVLDSYYGWEPEPGTATPFGDAISGRLLTLAIGNPVEDDATNTVQGRAILTLGLVPDASGIQGLWLALRGDLQATQEAGDGPSPWAVKAKVLAVEPLNLLIGSEFHVIGPQTGALEVELERKAKVPGPAAVLPANTGTRLEFGDLKATLRLNKDGFKLEVEATDSALVIASGEGDYFTSKVMTAHEYRINFNLGLGLDNQHGLYLKGGAGFSATIPIGKSIAGITLQTIQLGILLTSQGEFAQLDFIAAAAGSLKIGALTATVDGIGFTTGLAISRPQGKLPDTAKPLLPFLGYNGGGFKAPNGIGLVVDSDDVKGGGFLFHDKTTGQYAGVLQLQIGDDLSLSAAGLISSLPGSSIGYSLLVTGALLGLDWEIGLGFRITGVGILIGANRTVNVDALRAGVKNRTLDLILFPAHPVADAPRIVGALGTVFPPSAGQYMVGLAARIEWGTSVAAAANLELIVEGPAPWRIVLLGQLRIAFPRNAAKPCIRVNLDAVGIVDLDRGELSLDATLYDSHILALSLSGDMAMRVRWKGDRIFVLAIGGFHPRFTPPAGFPQLDRITFQMNELDGSLTLRFTAYLAITANSFQLGADLKVHLGFLGFSIDGELGFDLLLQDESPEITAGLHGSVALRFLGETFAAAGFDATYTGWEPQQHVEGDVTFKIWIFSKSKHFSKSFGDSAPPQQLPSVDPLPDLLAALADPRNWRADLPARHPLVTLRDGVGPGQVHPQGVLTVQQQVVPLGIDIDRYGRGRPAGTRRFTIDAITVGGAQQTAQPVTELFAAGQFVDMSDDERLTRPSFEPFTAGVAVGSGGVSFGGQSAGTAPLMAVTDLDYETCIVAPGGGCVREPQPHKPPVDLATIMAEWGAAALSPLRTQGDAQFQAPGRPVTINAVQFVLASTGTLDAPVDEGAPAAGSFTAAVQELQRQRRLNPALDGSLQVLPAYLVWSEPA